MTWAVIYVEKICQIKLKYHKRRWFVRNAMERFKCCKINFSKNTRSFKAHSEVYHEAWQDRCIRRRRIPRKKSNCITSERTSINDVPIQLTLSDFICILAIFIPYRDIYFLLSLRDSNIQSTSLFFYLFTYDSSAQVSIYYFFFVFDDCCLCDVSFSLYRFGYDTIKKKNHYYSILTLPMMSTSSYAMQNRRKR